MIIYTDIDTDNPEYSTFGDAGKDRPRVERKDDFEISKYKILKGKLVLITKEDVEAKEGEYNRILVIEKRKEEYGQLANQLDEIYHNIDLWRERIKAVKENNPK
jgi:hypothetical protein